MIYCMADIHGNYNAYCDILKQIRFCDRDTLYVIGDVIDRGKDSIKVLKDMMMRPNVIPILGNHEYMAIHCLRFLMQEITMESISALDKGIVQGLLEWQNVGGQATIEEFHGLSMEEKEDVLDYLEEFELYEEITVKGIDYILVHAGLAHFDRSRPLEDYELYELLFTRPDYETVYYPDKYLVTGHIPTRIIDGCANPDHIYKVNHHLAIDCGSGYGGRLGCICLDTGEEFYSEK